MKTQNQEYPLGFHTEVEPPAGLARRTCAKIWATLDAEVRSAEEQNIAPNSDTFLNSAFFSPESILPHTFLLQTSEPEEIEEVKNVVPRAKKRFNIEEEEIPPHSSRIGLIASVSVGIVIACFLYPMIRYAERSTRSYVAESWTSEINRRVGQYEQIYGTSNSSLPVEAISPYNLAFSGWQELRLEDVGLLPERFIPHAHTPYVLAAQCDTDLLFPEIQPPVHLYSVAVPDIGPLPGEDILLIIPGQEDLLRSAFGRAIFFSEGRVFARVLPVR